MNEFKQRQRLKKILYSRAALVLLVIICLLFAHSVWGVFEKWRGSVAEERDLQNQLSTLEGQRSYLASSTEALSTETGVEYGLQEKFGVAEPGEKEIVIVNEASSTESDSASGANPIESFFGKIFGWW